MMDFDYNSGQVTCNPVVVPADDATLTYTFESAKVAIKFTAKGSDKGRSISHIEQEIKIGGFLLFK